jgi:hypothetical protein
MLYRSPMSMLTLAAVLAMSIAGAKAFDDKSYPDWSGSWLAGGGPARGSFDPSKPKGLGQQAPLKPEFQKILEASIADIAAGGQGNDPGYHCGSHGMPWVMLALEPIFFVILPDTTYVIFERLSQIRRIFTDGRAWPAQLPGASVGYSIGQWIDTDGDRHYDTLEVETRGINGIHVYDSNGAPFHPDNSTVVKERINLDKADPNIMHNEITTMDDALTRPWTVTRTYRRHSDEWSEYVCAATNQHVAIGHDDYLLSADGALMPVKKGQRSPDLRYFDEPQP